jgi:hypothetical protein
MDQTDARRGRTGTQIPQHKIRAMEIKKLLTTSKTLIMTPSAKALPNFRITRMER